MTSINSKMGLRPGGRRKVLNRLSGVACPDCQAVDVRPSLVRGIERWTCSRCGSGWEPSAEDVAAYNARVRERDRI